MKTRLIFVALVAFGHVGQAATFTVSTDADSGLGSLRQAISDANAAGGVNTLTFTFTGTITLASALPAIIASTTIAGPGTNLLTISGNNAVKVLTVNNGATATLSGLTIANGRATAYANGAGIANAGSLTIQNCAFVNNQTLGGWGGAVFNSGDLVVVNSTFSGNQVVGENGGGSGGNTLNAGGGGAGMGGGIFNAGSTATFSGCAFIDNRATGGNGGDIDTIGVDGRGGGVNGGSGGNLYHNGANGGFGGGGSGSGEDSGNVGGTGGFGGGGGGSSYLSPGGQGGFGGGVGGTLLNRQTSAGGGGAGIGGGIFVASGTVTIAGCTFSGNQVAGGLGGSGIGPDFFNMAGIIEPVLSATTLGGGAVVVNPTNPPYLNSSLATITATPAAGWTLVNWMGDASGTDSAVNLRVTRNKFVQAIFGTSLTVTAFVSVYPQADSYPYGTVVKLTALPPAGLYFGVWNGSASGTDNPLYYVVTNANQSISAFFGVLSAGQSALTVIEQGRGHVTATPAANYYANGQTGMAVS